MKRTILLTVAVAALVALLTACGAGSVAGAETRDLITVSASDTVRLAPDQATVSFGVTTQETTAEKAQKENTEKVNEVIAVLTENGVEEKSIRTDNYNLYPQYDYSGIGEPKITGYTVSTTLCVQDQKIEELGALLATCVKAGINRVESVRFFCSNYDEAYRQALTQAVEVAREKAEALAQAAGKTLGNAVTVTEGWQDTSARYTPAAGNFAMKEEAFDLAAAPSFQPGETEIQANVTVAYEIK